MQFLKHGQNTPGMDSIFRGIRGFPVTAETESSRHARQLPLNPLCGHPVHPRALQPRPLAPLRAHGAAESLAGRRPRTPHPTIQSSLGPRDTASPDATRADGPPSGSELDLRAANQRLEREKRPHLCRRSEKCKILTGIRHRYSEVGVSNSQTPVKWACPTVRHQWRWGRPAPPRGQDLRAGTEAALECVPQPPCPPCWAIKSPSAWEAFQPWEAPPPDHVSDSRANLHLKTLYSTASLNPDFFRKRDLRRVGCSSPTCQAPVCCLHFDSMATRCPPPPGSH